MVSHGLELNMLQRFLEFDDTKKALANNVDNDEKWNMQKTTKPGYN